MYARDVLMMVADLDPDYGLVSKTQAGSDHSDRSTCKIDVFGDRRNSRTHENKPYDISRPAWYMSWTEAANNTTRNKSTSDNTGHAIRWWSDDTHDA